MHYWVKEMLDEKKLHEGKEVTAMKLTILGGKDEVGGNKKMEKHISMVL